jgi:hypothetical protein
MRALQSVREAAPHGIGPTPARHDFVGSIQCRDVNLSTHRDAAMPGSTRLAEPPLDAVAGGRGLVLGLLGLALALAVFAVWFQWRQTRRCLAFYGADAARAIQGAPRTELWKLAVDSASGRVVATEQRDISSARGLVHLRRGLVEDANFAWGSGAAGPLAPGDWDEALAFYSDPAKAPVAIVAFDLDGSGWATVVGRAGRAPLGRLRRGLRTWIDATRATGP